MPTHRTLTTAFAALLVCLSATATATASVAMELAVHEAARAARRENLDTLLVVVRESSRSAADSEIEGVLRAVEKMAIDSLRQEKDVDGIVDRKVRQAAAKIKARADMKPREVPRYTALTDAKADAVLSIDYRDRGGVSVQVTLLDGMHVYFTETVELDECPEPIAEYLKDDQNDAETKDIPKSDKHSESKENGKQKETKTTEGEVKLAPGSETIKGTGGKVRRSRIESRNVRSTSQQQRQDKSVTDGVAISATNQDRIPQKPPGPITELQRDVVNFAADNIGRKIGRGECWDLADQALRAAGAEPPKGYTFGTPIPLDEIQPGDILQFTAARFDEPGYWTIMGMPNHTAVVHAVGDTRAFILQQNFDGKRYVTTYDLNLNNLTAGRLEAFRPVPAQR